VLTGEADVEQVLLRRFAPVDGVYEDFLDEFRRESRRHSARKKGEVSGKRKGSAMKSVAHLALRPVHAQREFLTGSNAFFKACRRRESGRDEGRDEEVGRKWESEWECREGS
jgi:hypothetical protein